MSGILYAPKPAQYSYRCASCNEKIIGKVDEAGKPCGELEYWFKNRPKGQQNFHKKCWEDAQASDLNNDQPDNDSEIIVQAKPTQLQTILESKVFKTSIDIMDLKTDLIVLLEDRVKKRVESNPTVEKYSSTETGYLKHDAQAIVVNSALIETIAQKMMAAIKESAMSAETEGCANSFESMRGANSFHHLTAAQDRSRSINGQTQSLESDFAKPLFFLIHLGKRPILKCVIHGTICNESNWTCSKCADEEEERNRRRSLWSDF